MERGVGGMEFRFTREMLFRPTTTMVFGGRSKGFGGVGMGGGGGGGDIIHILMGKDIGDLGL